MDQLRGSNTKYIAEGIGLFSFVFLDFVGHKDNHYGSCITYSILEMYIMSRLHTHAKNIYLGLESADPDIPHRYWQYTQARFPPLIPGKSTSITHWATFYPASRLAFRSVYGNSRQISFWEDRMGVLTGLIIPIYDSYMAYLNNCEEVILRDESLDSMQKDAKKANLKILRQFIRNRVDIFDVER